MTLRKGIHAVFVGIVVLFCIACVLAVLGWFSHWLSQAASFL